MSSRVEAEAFLRDFHSKMEIWGIVVRDDRGKNTQTLFTLEITRNYRNNVLEGLVAEDYAEGPIKDELHKGADMWVFGKKVKEKEVYIKITMGSFGAQVICISFHIAERPMIYPYKSRKK
jgi:hypothetical protein